MIDLSSISKKYAAERAKAQSMYAHHRLPVPTPQARRPKMFDPTATYVAAAAGARAALEQRDTVTGVLGGTLGESINALAPGSERHARGMIEFWEKEASKCNR